MNDGSPFGRMPLKHLSLSNLLQYGDHLKVDHAALDAQHRAILELGVKVHDDWRRGASIDTLRPAMDKLSNLLHAHFAFEERVLRDVGYEQLDDHVAEHRRLDQALAAVCARLRSAKDGAKAPLAPGDAAVQSILKLTIGHVAGSDMQYCRALADGEPERPRTP